MYLVCIKASLCDKNVINGVLLPAIFQNDGKMLVIVS